MKMHRFILPIQLPQREITISDEEVVHQILKVLRLGVGHEIFIADGKGKEARGIIMDIRGDAVEVALQETVEITREAKRQVMLCCAILKRENFELVAQKAVEVGVTALLPVVTTRTVKKGLRFDRLQKIMKEAAEQSGQPRVPELLDQMDFQDALTQAKEFGDVLICDERGEKDISTIVEGKKSIAIFIGPEGGFTEEEIEIAKKMGAQSVFLSPFTLRAETAAIVAAYTGLN